MIDCNLGFVVLQDLNDALQLPSWLVYSEDRGLHQTVFIKLQSYNGARHEEDMTNLTSAFHSHVLFADHASGSGSEYDSFRHCLDR